MFKPVKTRSVGCSCDPEKQADCNGVVLHPKVRKFLVDSKSLVEARGVDVGQGMTEPL